MQVQARARRPDTVESYLIGVTLGLLVLHLGLWLVWGRGGVLVVLPWYPVVFDAFSVLAALTIAFVAIGRYQALREPAPFWIGAAGIGFAVFAVFDILTAPSVLPGDRPILAQLGTTSAWFFLLMLSALAVFLLVAVVASWPSGGSANGRNWLDLLIAEAVVCIVVSLAIVANEQFLPPLYAGGTWSVLQTVWKYAILAVYAVGAALAARRYARSREWLIGYLALTQVVFAYAMLSAILGQQLYDVWFYWLRILWVAGFSVMLLGLLSEYVDLYRREREWSRQLRQSEQRLGLLVEQSPLAVIEWSPEYRVVRWNPAAERIFGYTEAEAMGQHADLVPPARIEPAIDRVRHTVLAGLGGERSINENVTKDGRNIVCEWYNAPLMAPNGELLGVVSLVEDVTERERLLAEQVAARRRIEELAETAQRRAAELQSVLDNMVEAVIVASAARRIVLVNGAFTQVSGLDAEEIVGATLERYVEVLQLRTPEGHPKDADETTFSRALGGQTVVDELAIVRNVRTGQDAYVRMSAAAIRDERGEITGSLVVGRDVTELMELDRLKEQFIAVAAHELKTPVTIMKGYAQALLRTAGDLPESRRRMLDAISRGADRIDSIIVDLLDISQLTLGHLELEHERVDLSELAGAAIERISLMAPRHRLRVARSEPVVVLGDRQRLEQVILNLLDNAVRYSPGGGEVAVSVELSDREAVVSVRDEGVGIPRAKQGRIFQRFYRAHTRTPYDYGGMGVGLYISREIVAQHGGRIWFESQEGKGSTFHFSIPVAEAEGGAASSRPSGQYGGQ